MYDILITNGTVLDGSGAEGFCADVALKDGKIVALGKDLGAAHQVIDATGLVVTPGFIDSHSHSDASIVTNPAQIEKVEQGITTSIGGQCGSSKYPAVVEGKTVKMSSFLTQAAQIPQGANIATFAGHRAIRTTVMGNENRPATPEELEEMKELLADAIDAGAMGISFGLLYAPSCYAQLDELIALATVAGEKGGMIAAHIRNEGDFLVEAVEEFLAVVKAAGVRGVLSHHKSGYARNHGKVKTTLAMLEKANEEGFDVYCDVYPYTASRTSLASIFIPKEYRSGNWTENLTNPTLRALFKEQGLAKHGEDLSWVLLNHCSLNPAFSGKTIHEAAQLHGKDDWETLLDILAAQPGCCACFFTQCEEDLQRVMSWDRAMICTDSGVAGKAEFYHPRLRGSFPRALGRYVRQNKTVTLPEMIRKMTSLPAKVYGLEGKGYIREGYDGDICIFDPETIIDTATYTQVTGRAEGLRWVIVGGKVAAENAVYTGTTTGKVLLRKNRISG